MTGIISRTDPAPDTCQIVAYVRRAGKDKKILFLRSQIVYPIEEGRESGTSVLCLSDERKTKIAVRMEVEVLGRLLNSSNFKTGNQIDLTEATKDMDPVHIHIKGNLFSAPDVARDSAGAPLTMTFNEVAGLARNMNAQEYLGYSDWRAPTQDELKIALEEKNANGLAAIIDLQDTWSSSRDSDNDYLYCDANGSSRYSRWRDTEQKKQVILVRGSL